MNFNEIKKRIKGISNNQKPIPVSPHAGFYSYASISDPSIVWVNGTTGKSIECKYCEGNHNKENCTEYIQKN